MTGDRECPHPGPLPEGEGVTVDDALSLGRGAERKSTAELTEQRFALQQPCAKPAAAQ